MRLAGHSKYDTTLRYYLAVKDDLVDKARRAIKHRVSREMLERCLGSTQVGSTKNRSVDIAVPIVVSFSVACRNADYEANGKSRFIRA